MNTPFVALSIVVLIAVALLVYLSSRKGEGKPLSPLAGLAFACILAGLVFGERHWFGYALLGAGVVLAVIDMIRKSKTK